MLAQLILVLLSYLILDYLWMGFVVGDVYLRLIGPIARLQDGKFDVFIPSALVVYFVMTFALWFFVLRNASDLKTATLHGLILGFCLYAVFDFTNHALLKNYPIQFLAMDLIWGSVLNAVVAAIAFKAFKSN